MQSTTLIRSVRRVGPPPFRPFPIKRLLLCLLVSALAAILPSQVFAQGTAFTHQGRLDVGGLPATGFYDFQFLCYTSAPGGTVAVPPNLISNVPVQGGLFTVRLDFGATIFNGPARWLEMGVRPSGSGTAYTTLSPRQELTPTPYSIFAASAATSVGVGANAVGNAGLANSAVTTAKIADGTIVAADLSAPLLGNTFWSLTGNAGTTPGANFLGTTDDQAIELRVNNSRAFALQPGFLGRHTVVGGANQAEATLQGAVIAGGYNNTIHRNSHYATISGGSANVIQTNCSGSTISGGTFNWILTNVSYATIGGGRGNTIQTNSTYGTIAGGADNTLATAVIDGEFANTNAPHYSTIGGGEANVVNGADWATVPGGRQNVAGGNYSFAAGRRAKALYNGSFVWADDTDADFASTAAKQFAVRAENGVVIQSATTALELRGGGALRVAGAGIATATPVFTHRAAAGNSTGAESRIDHPHCNGQPNAILLVTHVFNPASTPVGTRNDRAVGVYYTGSRWAIYNLDGTAMPAGASFNVMVVRP